MRKQHRPANYLSLYFRILNTNSDPFADNSMDDRGNDITEVYIFSSLQRHNKKKHIRQIADWIPLQFE